MTERPLFSKSARFAHVVALLREMDSEMRHMALFAAEFWSEQKLREAAANGDLPGRPGVMAPADATLN